MNPIAMTRSSEQPLPPVNNFSGVVVLSLPSIVSTGFFLALLGVNRLSAVNALDGLDVPHVVEIVVGLVFLAVYFASYLVGAPFGPLFLLLAAHQAFELTRLRGVRSRRAVWAWTFVALGVLASLVYWGWLFHIDQLQLDL